MKIEVLKEGYIDLKRRYEGEILDIDQKLFSPKWMKKLSDERERPIMKPSAKKAKPVTADISLDDDVI
jgi:hypothetical protein